MKELGDILLNYVAPIGIVFISFYYLIEFCKDIESFNNLITKIKIKLNSIIHFVSNRKRYNYHKVLSSKEYLDFQKEILHKLYKDEINNYNKSHNSKIQISSLFGYEYDSVHIKFNDKISFPFTGVIDKRNGIKYDVKKIKYNHKQKKYWKLLKRTIKKPNKIGYALTELYPETAKLEAKCCTYDQNILTSHYLEYELYSFYKSKKYKKDMTNNEILQYLPMRKKYHDSIEKDKSIFTTCPYISSLLGIQAMVIVKNHSGNYDILRIRRNKDVVAKPGFLQFIPSGGFETFENKDDFDTKYSNYSLSKSIFRELMEECFGVSEEPEEKDISSEHIYSYSQVKRLIQLIDEGKAEFSLLGSSLSLVSFRHELSFVIKIEDEDYSNELKCNYESFSSISSISISEIKNKDFWLNFCNDNSDIIKLNATSASLLNLVEEFGYLD